MHRHLGGRGVFVSVCKYKLTGYQTKLIKSLWVGDKIGCAVAVCMFVCCGFSVRCLKFVVNTSTYLCGFVFVSVFV